MTKRFELTDAAWERVADLFGRKQQLGRPRMDDQKMLNAIFWVLCSGAAWRDLPARFGPWSTVYQRYRDWREDGTFEEVLQRLQIQLNEQGRIDLHTWDIDCPVPPGGRPQTTPLSRARRATVLSRRF